MQTTLEIRKKAIADSPRNALKRKNKVDQRGTSGLRMKKELKTTSVKAQKMIRGKVEPFAMLTVVQVVPMVVQVAI
jgi:hypothetical protein